MNKREKKLTSHKVRYSKKDQQTSLKPVAWVHEVAPRCVRLTGAHSPASHGRISLFFPALLFPVRKQKEKRYSRHRPGRDNSRSGVSTRMISALRRAADGQRTRSCFYLYLDGVPRTKHKLIVRIGVGISFVQWLS
jgi:hypothetical protein